MTDQQLNFISAAVGHQRDANHNGKIAGIALGHRLHYLRPQAKSLMLAAKYWRKAGLKDLAQQAKAEAEAVKATIKKEKAKQ